MNTYTFLINVLCCTIYVRIVTTNKNWLLETYKSCVDVNPNSNGELSQEAVSKALTTEMSPTNFLTSGSTTLKIGKGTVHTRNIKLFNNCVNACHTKDQEKLLASSLANLHRDIMALDLNKKMPASSESNVNNDPGTAEKRGISSLAPVENATSYSRKKPFGSPSRI